MADTMQIADMQAALKARVAPTITLWNRLEGRPRTKDFGRALAAEVRDALWMLTKQWQLGEFRGDDAGSPVIAKIHVARTGLAKYQADEHAVQPFEEDVPLEAKVEQRPIPFHIGTRGVALDLRLQMGRQWLKMIGSIGNFTEAYIQRYPIEMPDPTDAEDAPVCAHPEVWSQFAAVAGRAMDGAALYAHLTSDPAHHAYDGIPVPETQRGSVDHLAQKFVQWFDGLYYQPRQRDGNAWVPAHLEYQFRCSAPDQDGEKVLTAEEYYHGHLDWYNLDTDPGTEGLGELAGGQPAQAQEPITQSFIPVPVSFEGMPDTRWWSFEDRTTNFGDIQPDTTDLAKLLLIEFGLVYANDWFLFPLTLPVGSIARIEGLAVTNVFGERFWIEAAGARADENWQRWTMFSLSAKGQSDPPADVGMLLLPTVAKIQEGAPMETAGLIRDEMANMVWGVETMVPLADGGSKSGHEAATETRRFHQGLLETALEQGSVSVTPIEPSASIRYRIANTVPENWVPFVPVHVEGSSRQIQLQRAAMPRLLEGGPEAAEKVRPRTVLLREGLDRSPQEAYFVHEEEVPRAGIRVSQSFQRTRWCDGRVFVWLGVRKQTGRGEGHSGLAFDQIVPVG